ncbi:MAG: sulfatase, partial [Candidatus Aminicenantes bacterium]|nr:sulfatase [Candidatus Aminicenantes bacterium]
MKKLYVLVLLLCLMQVAIGASPKIKDPNILLITVDTLRTDHVGVYSDLNVKTPHMDALAARSSVFRWAFAHNPMTLPSHANIMTGTTPLYHGISENTGFKLENRFLTMAEWFKDQSYSTGAFIGAFPLDKQFGLDQGFDLYEDDLGVQQVYKSTFVERPASDVIAMAINWIEGQENKWFSFIHLFDAHEPYAPPAPYDEMYADNPYAGEVAFIDRQLGNLFDYLESKKMMDNTIIILTADHGEAFGEKGEWEHGYFAYNVTIHIPLMIYVPGGKSGWVEENAAHIDLFPTVCDLLGKNSPDHLQGESLVPFMNGTARRTTPIYFESMTPHFVTGLAPLSGFIQGSDKFIDLPIPEFYSIHDDWTENNNLANKANIKDLSESLQRLREKFTYHESGVRTGVDAKTLAKLKSLGYVSGGVRPEKKTYTKKDDPKTLAPVENIIHLAKLKHL